MRVIIITSPVPSNLKELYSQQAEDYVIAVDGAYDDLNIHVDLLVGDFDSLKDKTKIKDINTYELPWNKDITDTKKALEIALDKSPYEIIIFGGIGGNRPEHFIANLFLLITNVKITMINDHTRVYRMGLGVFECIRKDCYYSFFALEPSIVTLEGFMFPLESYELEMFDPLCISNELKNDCGYLIIEKGSVIVFESHK